MKNNVKVIFSANKLHNRINELGKQITNKYKNIDGKIILIGLLRGSFMFMADLCRAINVSHEVDFITTCSYSNNMFSNNNVKILKDLNENIYGKNVLIVEDIIDSGNTLKKIYNLLYKRNPKSLSVCTLLDKRHAKKLNIRIDYVGFSVSNDFMVGYGLDYAQKYRHLPYIGKVISNK
ncbi:hypoxanthine phosphoribosyltransferase [Buchnera aphidicola (Taiwanaphis decaspermi)]|uniref:hypoxanthine phosphoribosyltransferase n=1 Tax=Buchnera aphidicola TaxID=9 RepID=UPI0031B8875C